MHKRAEYNNILISLDSLTLGKQQEWLQSQPIPKTKEQAAVIKRTKRLIRRALDEEAE